MRKTYRYRLYPTRAQGVALHGQVDEACRFYNAALQERRDAYRMAGESLTYYDQANQLKEIRAAGDLGIANFSACQDVLKRLDKAFQAFFRRVRRGEKPGYPRFRSRYRYNSLTWPSFGDGCTVRESGRLYLQGIGEVKVKWHRPLAGRVKTVTIKREIGHWYVCFSVEVEVEPTVESGTEVGLDLGLTTFAVLSTGEEIQNPRYLAATAPQLRRAQRKLARRSKRSRRRQKARQAVGHLDWHLGNQRRDFHHKEARKLVEAYGHIAVEDLNIKGLAGGMLAKPVHDAGWSQFLRFLSDKAENAGRIVYAVNPVGTSQRCSRCGITVPKTLADRWHHCPACGLQLGRDHNSALDILRLAQRDGWSRQARTAEVRSVA